MTQPPEPKAPLLKAWLHWMLFTKTIRGHHEGKVIYIDDATLRNCSLENCRIIYAALPGNVVIEGGLSISRCEIQLVGAAARSLNVVNFLTEHGAK